MLICLLSQSNKNQKKKTAKENYIVMSLPLHVADAGLIAGTSCVPLTTTSSDS